MTNAVPDPKRLPPGLFLRLSTMMALQYGTWGAWIPILYFFLRDGRGFDAGQIGTLFIVGALGPLAAPFVAQIADRWLATQKVLGITHLLAGIVIWQLSWIDSFTPFLAVSTVYSLLYGPTVGLTNALAFHHLPDRDRHFGLVRVCGAAGFIPASILVAQWLFFVHTPGPEQAVDLLVKEGKITAGARETLLKERQVTLPGGEAVTGTLLREDDRQIILMTAAGERTIAKDGVGIRRGKAIEDVTQKKVAGGMADGFKLSAILGILMGLYCFTLPHTPPQKGREKIAFVEALRQIRKRSLLVLFMVSVPLSCIHQLYFVHTGRYLGTFDFRTDWVTSLFGVGGGGMMTIGQFCETIIMVTIGLYVARISRKTLLLAGVMAYVLRFALFAWARQIETAVGLPATWSIIIALLLHGPCFTWFWFLGFMIVDEESTKDVRASAQSLYNLVLMGVGGVIGSIIAAWIGDHYTVSDNVIDYTGLFSWPFWGSLACFVLLAVFYPARTKTPAAG